jgi:hypothetical protein
MNSVLSETTRSHPRSSRRTRTEPTLKKKLLFVLGAAVGYVVGTRTGRQGYEKLKSQVGDVWQKPVVQEGIVRAEVFAEEKIPLVGGAVSAAVQTAADSVTSAVKKNEDSSPAAGSADDSTPNDSDKPSESV